MSELGWALGPQIEEETSLGRQQIQPVQTNVSTFLRSAEDVPSLESEPIMPPPAEEEEQQQQEQHQLNIFSKSAKPHLRDLVVLMAPMDRLLAAPDLTNLAFERLTELQKRQ